MARKRAQREASGYTILVVDDQEETLASVRMLLDREGHTVVVADSGRRALEIFGQQAVHLLLVDYFMPRMTGEKLITEIRKIDPEVQIVLQTGYSGEKPPREMLHKLDIQGYHDKAEGPDKLLIWVDVALKAYEQLRRVREAELLKSQLLANVSHEFRTPLHVILGYTEILREEHGGAAGETFDRIRNNAESLLDLVNDFLRLSELATETALATPEVLDGASLRRAVQTCMQTLIRDKPLHVDCRVPETLPPIAANPAMLRVVLRNLLSNAVKFTTEGTITIVGATDGDQVRLSITDTGIGIDPEHHERIFEAFTQVDGTSTRAQDGTGVGLPIARKLVRLAGGDLSVASALGRGATFTLRLPRVGTRPPIVAPPDPAAAEA